MKNLFRRLKKKALLKELRSWTAIMAENNLAVTGIEEEIEKHGDELSKVELTRFKQLKKNYLESYNQAKMEAELIQNQLKELS